jgi:hypothetical protein
MCFFTVQQCSTCLSQSSRRGRSSSSPWRRRPKGRRRDAYVSLSQPAAPPYAERVTGPQTPRTKNVVQHAGLRYLLVQVAGWAVMKVRVSRPYQNSSGTTTVNRSWHCWTVSLTSTSCTRPRVWAKHQDGFRAPSVGCCALWAGFISSHEVLQRQDLRVDSAIMTSAGMVPCSMAMHSRGFSWLWLNHPSRCEPVLCAAGWSIAPGPSSDLTGPAMP